MHRIRKLPLVRLSARKRKGYRKPQAHQRLTHSLAPLAPWQSGTSRVQKARLHNTNKPALGLAWLAASKPRRQGWGAGRGSRWRCCTQPPSHQARAACSLYRRRSPCPAMTRHCKNQLGTHGRSQPAGRPAGALLYQCCMLRAAPAPPPCFLPPSAPHPHPALMPHPDDEPNGANEPPPPPPPPACAAQCSACSGRAPAALPAAPGPSWLCPSRSRSRSGPRDSDRGPGQGPLHPPSASRMRKAKQPIKNNHHMSAHRRHQHQK